MCEQERDYDGEDKKSHSKTKLFIGGLSLQTTKEDLQDYFSHWGEITDAVVITDAATKRSRGFGFVTYTTVEEMDNCLAERPHTINDKEVEAKRAVPREESNPSTSQKTKKIFLGGLSLNTEEQDIRAVLEPLGEVTGVQIMTDKTTGKPRGFGFATFAGYETADKVTVRKFIKIKDRDVEVKKAISQEDMRRQDTSRSSWGSSGRGGGGGGGGRGGYYREGDSYGRSSMGGGGGYRDYRQMPTAYEGAYASNPYYMTGGYPVAGGYDRGQGQNFAYQDYYGMYGAPSGMGSYGQAASSYGPQRGYEAARDRDHSAMGGTRASQYHPYRR